MSTEQLEEINTQLLHRIKQLEKELDSAEAALRQAGYYQQENGEWSTAY